MLCSEKTLRELCHFMMLFCLFTVAFSVDEFIDVILGNRVYLTCLYVYNKIDQISIEEIDRLARLPHHVVISCEMNLNMDYLVEKIWEYLALVRVYTKKPGNAPDLGSYIFMFVDEYIIFLIIVIFRTRRRYHSSSRGHR